MGLLRVDDVSISFGTTAILKGISFQIEEGERIGLLGRNGSGKSTLMRLLAGEVVPDSGRVISSGNARVAMLPQDVPGGLRGRVYDVVASGGMDHIELLREYHDLTRVMTSRDDPALLKRMEEVQHRIEAAGAWGFHGRVETIIARGGLDGHALFDDLSAGLKRRVLFARALAKEPDCLLLDEPTNHLDIGTILAMEASLLEYGKTIVFVTHDRVFLQKLATRIIEIDRGNIRSFLCSYKTYLERRQAILEAEEKEWQEFDKKLAREEIWIRQGIKARRSRDEGRVRALEKMRQERAKRQEQDGVSRLAIQEAERSGRIVAEARKISFNWGTKRIVDAFSTTIMRGDKVGIIGPNGAGKTTLLRLLLGEIEPEAGKVRLGEGLQIAYFDQLRARLDENGTVRENVGDGNEYVNFGGSRRHVVGYLQDFLFTAERIVAPVRILSGGERMRLLLAKLFAVPSNVLVLDEPTNDLDAETLELLEYRLVEYSGTILVVSHDREFLNNVVTSTIVFEGDGRVEEYVGGYDDWIRQRGGQDDGSQTKTAKVQKEKKQRPVKEKQKLSFNEVRELERLPAQIEELEAEKRRLVEDLNRPEFYADRDRGKVERAAARVSAVEHELEEAYQRWDELEDLAGRLGGGQG